MWTVVSSPAARVRPVTSAVTKSKAVAVEERKSRTIRDTGLRCEQGEREKEREREREERRWDVDHREGPLEGGVYLYIHFFTHLNGAHN